MSDELDPQAQEVLTFWFEESSPSDWFAKNDQYDKTIEDRFRSLWRKARHGELDHWQDEPRSCLALIIVLDQFSRNIFRGRPDAFAGDKQAIHICRRAVSKLMDETLSLPERQFLYMPLMHSENLTDQDLCVDLFIERLGNDPELNKHALEHRDVIDRFGRFPHRNTVLDRETTPEEQAFMDESGWNP